MTDLMIAQRFDLLIGKIINQQELDVLLVIYG